MGGRAAQVASLVAPACGLRPSNRPTRLDLFWTDARIPAVGVAWRTDDYLKGLYGWWVERYPLAT